MDLSQQWQAGGFGYTSVMMDVNGPNTVLYGGADGALNRIVGRSEARALWGDVEQAARNLRARHVVAA